jgi:RNA polymerase sigma-70 factor (ECF subfamily)
MPIETDRRTRFEALVAEVHDPLERYLRRRTSPDDVDDVLGDVLLTMWRRLDHIPAPALPWCYGVARRTLANHRRAAARRLRLVTRLEAEPASPAPDHQAPDPELAAAMARLPGPDLEVLTLWAWESLEPREIAVVLGITTNAVSLRLTKARARLSRLLGGQDPRRGGHEEVGHAGEHSS